MCEPLTRVPTIRGRSGCAAQTSIEFFSHTSTNLGSMGTVAVRPVIVTRSTSSNRTSGHSSVKRAVKPPGVKLAGTIAVDLSLPLSSSVESLSLPLLEPRLRESLTDSLADWLVESLFESLRDSLSESLNEVLNEPLDEPCELEPLLSSQHLGLSAM